MSSGPSPIAVVEAFNRAWIRGDIDDAMRVVAPDCVYALYISDELLTHGGETRGRDNIRAALTEVRIDFEYVLYRPYNVVLDGDVCRYRVEFMYRHRRSGEMLNGNLRFLMQVRDGLIVRADEYHDRAMVEAFLRLFNAPQA
ncbi:MAG: nuclear transport factor 2 family protein [Rhizobiales bacterium]|nr:nuclear transport factor 2 family protein [Hyphomicrobiales bacterium]